MQRQQNPRRLAIQQRSPQKAHRRAIVHRRTGHIKREPRNNAIHEDTKVIPQEGPRDAQLPGGGDDEEVADGEQGVGGVGDVFALEGRVGRLVTEGALVEEVAQEAEGEDGGGEGVAGCLAVAVEGAG